MPASNRRAFGSRAVLETTAFYSSAALGMMSMANTRWCWESSRGYTGDFQSSLGGVCAAGANDVCFVFISDEDDVWSGCVSTTTRDAIVSEMALVNITADGIIQWGQGQTETPDASSMVCYLHIYDVVRQERVCFVPAVNTTTSGVFVPRNVLSSMNTAPYAHSAGTLPTATASRPASGAWAAVARACGCTPQNSDSWAVEWPYHVCRSNTDIGDECTVHLDGVCGEHEFNCGTYYGWLPNMTTSELGVAMFVKPSAVLSRLCGGCNITNGVQTVGQCREDGGTMCSGVLNNGECATGYSLCTTGTFAFGTPPAYALARSGIVVATDTFESAVLSLLNGIETVGSVFVWRGNDTDTAYDLFGVRYPNIVQQVGPSDSAFLPIRWLPDVYGLDQVGTTTAAVPERIVTTYDPVNCVPMYGQIETAGASVYALSTVETPAYLATTAQASINYPGGLTEAALESWCGKSTIRGCDAPRRWWCIDVGQTLVPSTEPAQCVLRRQWRSQFKTYSNSLDQLVGTFSDTKKDVWPDCYAWVSGLDADWACQHPTKFTGCVITTTNRHYASSAQQSASSSSSAAANQTSGIMGDDGGEVWLNSLFNGTAFATYTGVNSSSVCAFNCTRTTKCRVWSYTSLFTSCFQYDLVSDPFALVTVEGWTTGMSSGAASAGLAVPRVHSGPVYQAVEPGHTGTLFEVTGADFFVTNGGTLPFGSVVCNETADSDCVFPSGTVLHYYGSRTADDIIDTADVTNGTARLLTRTEVQSYEQRQHSFAVLPQMVRLTLGSPIDVLGVLEEEFANGHNDAGFGSTVLADTNASTGVPLGRGRGLRGVFRGPNGSLTIEISVYDVKTQSRITVELTPTRWLYNPVSNTTVVMGRETSRHARRTCVPLTMRIPVSKSTFEQKAVEDEIYRRDPVDCIVAGSVASDNNVDLLFEQGGICSGTQQLTWPSGNLMGTNAFPADAGTDIMYNTNLRYYSQWFKVMSSSTTSSAAMMYNPTITADTASVHGINIGSLLGGFSTSLGGAQAGTAALLEYIPNCEASDTDNCVLAFDLTGYIPCTGVASTVWSTCMKPTMMALYPLYAASDAIVPSTPFLFPFSLYSGDPNVNSLTDQSIWIETKWSQYTPMVHYCDRYGADTADSQPLVNGWKPGKLVYCENDAYTATEREGFCRTKQPWWVVTGRLIRQLSFEDLCPFANRGNSVEEQYCFVFSDGTYPTISAFLASQLPEGLSWASTTFYYVPFTFEVLQLILMDIRVIDTLITNTIFGQDGIVLNSDNYGAYGPTASFMAEHLMKTIGSNTTKLNLVNGLCGDGVGGAPIVPEVIEIMYTVIQGYYNPLEDNYIFPSTSTTTSLSDTVTLSPFEVTPRFGELNTLIEYDNIRIDTIGPNRAEISANPDVLVNQVRVCTRFQVNAQNVVIRNVVLNQTLCAFTGVLQQTPIVVSGATGAMLEISNVTIVDSSAAVATLGGDALVYRYLPTVNVDGMLVFNVSFVYNSETTIPVTQHNVLGVFGRSVGVPFLISCHSERAVPDISTGVFYLSDNCGLEYVPEPTDAVQTCGLPQMCATEFGCCGNPAVVAHIPDPDCVWGFRCAGNNSEIDLLFRSQPNSRKLCSSESCSCADTPAGPNVPEDGSCVEVVGNTTCFYDRETCWMECSSGTQYHNMSTTGEALDYALGSTPGGPRMIQDWQFSAGADTLDFFRGWYGIQDTYPSSIDAGQSVNYVRGIGHGQYVWTVRRPATCGPLGGIKLPSELRVEARLLPLQTNGVPFEEITVVPDSATGSETRVYASEVKLRLMTDWFFASANTSVYQPSFLTALKDTTKWCIGVNTTLGRLQVLDCTIEHGGDVKTNWFYDSIKTRLHVSGHPFMCPSYLSDVPMDVTCDDTVQTSDPNLVLDQRVVAGVSRGAPAVDGETIGGPLVYAPCLPCNIGAERVELDDTINPQSTQLFENTGQGAVDYIDKTPLTIPDGARAVTTATGTDWKGYIIDSSGQCATRFGNGSTGWVGCTPDLMFPPTRGDDCVGMRSGVFRYVCGQGYGSPITEIKSIVGTCTLNSEGTLTTSHGFGARVRITDVNTFEVINGGHGYLNGARATSGTCTMIVLTTTVIIQPGSLNFDVAGGTWGLSNISEYTGFLEAPFIVNTGGDAYNLGDLIIPSNVLAWALLIILATVHVVLMCYKPHVATSLTKKNN